MVKHYPYFRIVACCATLLLMGTVSFAQVTSGTILGTVTDATNAAVAKAKVAITNTGTNIRSEVVTNNEGNFELPYLQAGQYSVSVEAPGFKSFVQTGITLSTDQKYRVRCERGDERGIAALFVDPLAVELSSHNHAGHCRRVCSRLDRVTSAATPRLAVHWNFGRPQRTVDGKFDRVAYVPCWGLPQILKPPEHVGHAPVPPDYPRRRLASSATPCTRPCCRLCGARS